MPTFAITRTHCRGKKLDRRNWEEPVTGEIGMASIRRDDLSRTVQYLYIERRQASDPDPLPPLWEPHWLTFGSQGMMVVGFEEIDGARYYQGWYVRWE